MQVGKDAVTASSRAALRLERAAVQIQLASAGNHVNLLDLPWDVPLGRWNDPRLVRMARGPSRHLVRFVEVNGRVYALKEIADALALREYGMLREMASAAVPVVTAVGTVTSRTGSDEQPLEGILVTRYLDFALPYSYLLAREGGVERQHRLLDAAAVLLVQMHLDGFVWGDCSLANILFRRDAGGLSAYVVDSETAEHHPQLSDRRREADLDIAVDNFIGGVEDLIAAGRIDPYTDSVAFADRLAQRYQSLWAELTKEEEFAADERWRLEDRIRRLNDLGFDAAEMALVPLPGGDRIRIRPTLVEEGHHHRKLLRLTGIDVQENQARRLLNDLASFRTFLEKSEGRPVPEAMAAYRWVIDRFEPFVDAITPDLAARLEPAEAFHEFLEHRWFLSEAAGGGVSEEEALKSFVANVLSTKPVERVLQQIDPTGELEIRALQDFEDSGDEAYPLDDGYTLVDHDHDHDADPDPDPDPRAVPPAPAPSRPDGAAPAPAAPSGQATDRR